MAVCRLFEFDFGLVLSVRYSFQVRPSQIFPNLLLRLPSASGLSPRYTASAEAYGTRRRRASALLARLFTGRVTQHVALDPQAPTVRVPSRKNDIG